MKLTVLSENAVLYPGLEGEFGLSVYLEEGDARLLFDAGERGACLRNAEKLGIDLRQVTATAFSHNHRDHCGGCCPWRRSCRRKFPFTPTPAFSSGNGGTPVRPASAGNLFPDARAGRPAHGASWFFQQGLTGFRCLADDCIQMLRMCIFWETFRPLNRKRRSIPPRSWRAGWPPCPGYLPGGAGLCGGYSGGAGGAHRLRP